MFTPSVFPYGPLDVGNIPYLARKRMIPCLQKGWGRDKALESTPHCTALHVHLKSYPLLTHNLDHFLGGRLLGTGLL